MPLKSTKSAGLDQILNNLLKIAAPIISRSLAKIFNISVNAGVFPGDWKLACVAPIFKNGSKSELGNYRPISMLSAVARVFERLIYEQLSEYFQENNFLTKYQSGFRKFHSTVTSMLKTTNDWLLNKLSRYGVNDIELKWFESYLSNQHQCCCLNRARSKMREIKIGVPQGLCLGSLLFLIYINDLPLVLKHATPSYLLTMRKWLHPFSKPQSCKINLQKISRTSFNGWRITSCGLSILKMSKNCLPRGTLKILYNFLIETHFRYGNIIWQQTFFQTFRIEYFGCDYLNFEKKIYIYLPCFPGGHILRALITKL